MERQKNAYPLQYYDYGRIFSSDGAFFRFIEKLESHYGIKPKIFPSYPNLKDANKFKNHYGKSFSSAIISFVLVFTKFFQSLTNGQVFQIENARISFNALLNSLTYTDLQLLKTELTEIYQVLDMETLKFENFVSQLESMAFSCQVPLSKADLQEFAQNDRGFF